MRATSIEWQLKFVFVERFSVGENFFRVLVQPQRVKSADFVKKFSSKPESAFSCKNRKFPFVNNLSLSTRARKASYATQAFFEISTKIIFWRENFKLVSWKSVFVSGIKLEIFWWFHLLIGGKRAGAVSSINKTRKLCRLRFFLAFCISTTFRQFDKKFEVCFPRRAFNSNFLKYFQFEEILCSF